MKKMILLVAALATALSLVLSACGGKPAAPKPPNVSQIATAHGWSDAQFQSVPTYPMEKEILFTDSFGYTVDFATFHSNAARDKWVARERISTAKLALDGIPVTMIADVRYYKGPLWAAVDEGPLGNVASGLGG